MKIREVLRLADRHLAGPARSIAAGDTPTIVAPVEVPDRLVGPQGRAGSPNIIPDADPNNGMIGDVPPALSPSPTSFVSISTPNTRDLDFIKTQIARLPRHRGQ
jgi:hypothetical protein